MIHLSLFINLKIFYTASNNKIITNHKFRTASLWAKIQTQNPSNITWEC